MALLPPELFNSLMECMNVEFNQRRKVFIVQLQSIHYEFITNLILRSRALGGYYLLNATNKKQLIKVNEKWTLKRRFEVQTMDSKKFHLNFTEITENKFY